MTEKKFDVIDDGFSKWIIDTTLKEDRHEGTLYTAYDMCHKLNELYEENEQLRKHNKQLKERLEKINGGYGHLTHRNGLTANEWLIESQERELQKKNEQISDWIEQHSKDVVKIGEQQATIDQLNLAIDDLLSHTSCNEIKKKNEILKKQLNEMIILFSESGLDYFISDELEDYL